MTVGRPPATVDDVGTEAQRRPRRIQRLRHAGWRTPPGAVFIGPGSRWENPFRVGSFTPVWRERLGWPLKHTPETAVAAFAEIVNRPDIVRKVRQLEGLDVVCWCPLDQPCHGDLYLQVANR